MIQSLPKKYGITVLISSHLLSEIEQIATSVGIIHEGEMIFQGSIDSLKSRSRPTIIVKTGNNRYAQEFLFTKGFSPSIQGDRLVFNEITDAQVIQINKLLIDANIDVLRIEEEKKTLESIFLEMTGRENSL